MAKNAHILLEKSLFFKRTNTFVGSVFDYLAKVYNFDTKRLPLGSNRLLPKSNRLPLGSNRLLPKSNRLPLFYKTVTILIYFNVVI